MVKSEDIARSVAFAVSDTYERKIRENLQTEHRLWDEPLHPMLKASSRLDSNTEV